MTASTNAYETSELLAQYLNLHFASDDEVLSPSAFHSAIPLQPALHFPQRCAKWVIEAAREAQVPLGKALDLGCAVGGSSFALSEAFSHVVGIDFSQSFIHAAQQLQKKGELGYSRKDQGHNLTQLKAKIPRSAQPKRIDFQVGDACNLSPELRDFDAILMANLLCRLPDPRQCLRSLCVNSILKKGGILVILSPYSWLQEYAVREHWLGGADNVGSESALRAWLTPPFRLVKEEQQPLIIREHERKFQLIIAHLTIWQLVSSEITS